MIGDRIKGVRKERLLSQKEFAKSIGISQNYLSQIEKGRSEPSRPLLLAIEYRYLVRSEWLESGEGKREKDVKASEDAVPYGNSEELQGLVYKLHRLYKRGGDKMDVVKKLLNLFA